MTRLECAGIRRVYLHVNSWVNCSFTWGYTVSAKVEENDLACRRHIRVLNKDLGSGGDNVGGVEEGKERDL